MKKQFRDSFADIKKILIIQFRPFGDVLLATSYLQALKNRFPAAAIDFLVKKPFQEVLAGHPCLSHVEAFEQKRGFGYLFGRIGLFLKIRRRRYDLVIDQQHGTGSGQVVLTCGARYKLGWSSARLSMFYNLKAVRGPVRYYALRNFDMLSPLGIAEEPPRFFFRIDSASNAYIESWLQGRGIDPQQMVLMAPGSPRAHKKWHPDRYAELTDLIQMRTGMKVILLGAPNEHEDCNRVMAMSRRKPILGPETTINQAAALLKLSRLLICNDGGLNHLSVALEVPSLAVFGSTSPEIWSPQGHFPHHYHLHNPKGKGDPHNGFGITAEQAFQKVLELLAEIQN